MTSNLRVGVFVDAENIKYNGGYQLRYDILRRFAARNSGHLLRLNTYMAFDSERAKVDSDYAKSNYAYQQMVRGFGWKVTVKIVRRYTDEEGNTSTKANADLDLAVDAMLQSDQLEQILLVTGDGDFLQMVNALQNKGCRVDLLGFRNVSRTLQRQVDAYYSGYLVPDLLPVSYEPRNEWGKAGSVVRGVCIKWIVEKGYGFLRYARAISPNLWITDPRDSESPYVSVFCHASELSEDITEDLLHNRETVFEFYLKESGQKDLSLMANNVRLAIQVERAGRPTSGFQAHAGLQQAKRPVRQPRYEGEDDGERGEGIDVGMTEQAEPEGINHVEDRIEQGEVLPERGEHVNGVEHTP